MPKHIWSDEELSELARELRKGKKPREIAKVICGGKFSKASVVGVIHRAGGAEKFCEAHGYTFLGERHSLQSRV